MEEFLPTQTSSKESFTHIIHPETTQYKVFSQVKNPDGLNVIARTEDLDVHKSHKADLCPHTLLGTGDRVRVVFDGRYDPSPGALVHLSFKRQAIT